MVGRHPSATMSRYLRRVGLTSILIVVVVALAYSLVVDAQESNDSGSAAGAGNVGDSSATGASDSSSTNDSKPTEKKDKPPISEDEWDWGSFYDPNNVFCGKFDCYKILGFDHETWGLEPPSLKDITKSYRSLSRKWHPDKNKVKGAREKFVVSRCVTCRLDGFLPA